MVDPRRPTAPDASDGLVFTFAFALPEVLAGLAFGVTPASARLTITGDRLVVRFGPWCVDTPLANVAGAELTGPFSWLRVLGPARLSLRDRGLTFATNDRQGVCIRFRTPVPGVDPLGVVRHPGLTVTVADAPALVEVLRHAAALTDEATARIRRHPGRPVTASSSTPAAGDVLEDMVDDLHALTAKELRARARSLGIGGASSMKKDELVAALSHQGDR
jgi:hypothetical protein